ncbi:MAG: cadmium-translocating P-type ATPase [Spirochaetaceae bacterium]|nr:cadmium-translocating P-type ATPase [Spirochaetaceae bacterium]
MVEMKLEGLQCASCAAKIEEKLKSNEFLQEVSFSFATKKLSFKSDLESEKLQNLVQNLIDKIEEGITVGIETPDSQNVIEKKSFKDLFLRNARTIGGALIFFTLLISDPTEPILKYSAYISAYLLIGGDIAWRALKNLLKGRLFDEYFLMTLATTGAFALGEIHEAVAVMLFYKIGEGFQNYAVDHSRRSIRSLLNIKAEYANLINGESIERVTPRSLQIDDHIVVLAGEKVPVDGVIVRGTSSLDTSALTGESMPRSAEKDSDVLSGFINIEAPLTVKVTKRFENSAVSRILHMVENATGKKAKTEQFITKFARVYTPIVVFGALALAFIPPLLGSGDVREWISRSLIFLVISCPCALVLSVPLGFFGGLGAASRKGILIKGGNYLEALNSIDTFVFDKTGTLTKGNFAIEKISGTDTLKLAAQLEQQSTHPIARSIVSAYGKNINKNHMTDIREYPGQGIRGLYKDKELLVGNHRLLERFSIDFNEEKYAGTTVHIAYGGKHAGSIYIADEIKESSWNMSRKLKTAGADEVIMLTGDQKHIAEYVGEKLEIDKVYSELLPEDKMQHLEDLIEKGKKVLFTGDGINDAPVLARADIGVAMGGLGSDAAIEAADIVLMTDDPSKLLDAKKIAQTTRAIVLQNIIFALGVKLFFLTLGALGHASMYEAIFADVGVALLAVLNSMRILKK